MIEDPSIGLVAGLIFLLIANFVCIYYSIRCIGQLKEVNKQIDKLIAQRKKDRSPGAVTLPYFPDGDPDDE